MLTVHHLQVSQSERIVWLCEELNLDYNLVLHKRDPLLSPPSIKALHPLGAAPIIQDDDLPFALAESGACVDYIIHAHGGGRLALPPSHPQYATYLYWLHFANGTLQPTLGRLMTLSLAGVEKSNDMFSRMLARMAQYLQHVDEHLSEQQNPWFAGAEFTAADVMAVSTLTTMRVFYPVDLSAYKGILAYLKRVGEREAYRRAHERGDPGLEYMLDGPPPKSFLERIKGGGA